MEVPTIMVQIICCKEQAELVAETLSDVLQDVGETPTILVSNITGQETNKRLVTLQTDRVYTGDAHGLPIDHFSQDLFEVGIVVLRPCFCQC